MLVGVSWMFFFTSTTLRNTEFLQSIKNISIKKYLKISRWYEKAEDCFLPKWHFPK